MKGFNAHGCVILYTANAIRLMVAANLHPVSAAGSGFIEMYVIWAAE